MGTLAFDTISTKNGQNTHEINIIDEHPSVLEDESSSGIDVVRRHLKPELDLSLQSFPAQQISPMGANQSTMFFTNTQGSLNLFQHPKTPTDGNKSRSLFRFNGGKSRQSNINRNNGSKSNYSTTDVNLFTQLNDKQQSEITDLKKEKADLTSMLNKFTENCENQANNSQGGIEKIIQKAFTDQQ